MYVPYCIIKSLAAVTPVRKNDTLAACVTLYV